MSRALPSALRAYQVGQPWSDLVHVRAHAHSDGPVAQPFPGDQFGKMCLQSDKIRVEGPDGRLRHRGDLHGSRRVDIVIGEVDTQPARAVTTSARPKLAAAVAGIEALDLFRQGDFVVA